MDSLCLPLSLCVSPSVSLSLSVSSGLSLSQLLKVTPPAEHALLSSLRCLGPVPTTSCVHLWVCLWAPSSISRLCAHLPSSVIVLDSLARQQVLKLGRSCLITYLVFKIVLVTQDSSLFKRNIRTATRQCCQSLTGIALDLFTRLQVNGIFAVFNFPIHGHSMPLYLFRSLISFTCGVNILFHKSHIEFLILTSKYLIFKYCTCYFTYQPCGPN